MTIKQAQPPEIELMTAVEVADLFRVDPKTVKRWAQRGRLTMTRTPGGHLRYFRAEVLELLETSKKGTGR